MSQISVMVPVAPDPVAGTVEKAERVPLPEGALVTLVENGKPRARDLMRFIAAELERRIPGLSVDVHSKASAGKPLEGDEAKVIAARAHLVITGVGD